MNLDALQLYCDIVRLHSFSRGAAEHNVSQSAASQTIQQIETDLRVQLLDRSKRPFSVTAEGQKFYETCREMLHSYEETCAEISQGRQELAGTVRIAAIYSVGLHGMSGQMQRFLSRYPRARVRLECLHPHEVVEAILKDEADLGVLSYPPAKRGLSIVPLHSEEMVFVAHPGHRLARKKRILPADLDGEPFIAFEESLAIRKAIDRALRKEDVRPNVVMEFDNVETIKQAIIIGTGVSLLPAPAVIKEAGIGTLASRPFDLPGLKRPIGAIFRKNKPMTPAVSRFLELLKEDPGAAVSVSSRLDSDTPSRPVDARKRQERRGS
jgi:DNA-binding transcriptional LysR family regulator